MVRRIGSLARTGRSPSSIAVRVLADVLIVVAGIAIIIVLRNTVAIWPFDDELANAGDAFLVGATLLPLLMVGVFHLFGLYEKVRLYQERYKALAIVQAVTLAHLLFTLVVFLLWEVLEFPRSLLPLSWLLTCGLMLVSRQLLSSVAFVRNFLDRMDSGGAGDVTNSDTKEKVLVVGGAGFIGSALIRQLLDDGYSVRVLDNLAFGIDPLRDLLGDPDLELVRGDLRQVDHVLRAATGVDSVVHLGAIVGDPACALDEQLTIQTNLLATRMLAEVCACAGARRFVFASTCSVYGAGDEVLDESSSLAPVSLYAESKIACEEILADLASDSFSPVIMRFGTIYGLSGRSRFDLVVNLLTAKALVEKDITVFGGQQWRPFVHVDDAAQSVRLALSADRSVVHGRTFNVGSNEQNLQIDEVAELIRAAVPGAEISQHGQDGERRDYRVDFTRIKKELGFVPKWSIEMGIQQVIEALTCGVVGDYTEPRYSNVRSLSEQRSTAVDLADGKQSTENEGDVPQGATLSYQIPMPDADRVFASSLMGGYTSSSSKASS